LFRKFFAFIIVLALACAAAFVYWAQQPIIAHSEPAIAFSVLPGSSLHSTVQQIAAAGAPVDPTLLALLARGSGKGGRLKAGSYELKPGTTPLKLIDQLVRGEFAQESLVIIEGWTFKQMRQAFAAHPGLKHETSKWSEQELIAKLTPDFRSAEGLFFPDTYLFAKGSSDLQVYRQAHALLLRRLADGWAKRDPTVPYKNPYEALIMASIVEKETGKASERDMIAGVFVNRLRLGMLLQTDPAVIYGMGERYQGQIRKRDLQIDTPYNTYMRTGLPPTPIALPGAAALMAALNPAHTDALYFVSRNDGTSEFSANLEQHNRAVNKYQR
jgi:UPF0755 protein